VHHLLQPGHGEEKVPHAHLSPSSAHRWFVCAGSLKHERVEGQSDNFYAEEGSHAHKILEAVLEGGMVLVGDIIDGKPATAERIQQAIEVRDFVRRWHKLHPNFVMETESPVEIGAHLGPIGIIDMPPGTYAGTIDVAAWNEWEVVVLDAKFGFVRVEPKDNPQLMSYAVGIALELHQLGFNPTFYTLIIAQPDYEGVMEFREHRITLRDISDWIVGHKERILAAWRGDTTLDASDEKACRYCPGRFGCPARLEAVHNFNQETWLEAHSLDELLPYVPRLRAICKDLEAKAAHELLEGRDIKGYKLVESRSIRKWNGMEPDLIASLISSETKAPMDKMFERKMLSPAKMEKYIKESTGENGKSIVNQLAVIPKGGPKLVPESDPRPPFDRNDFTQEDVDALSVEE
jgi:hypothetical protein